jgi:hypothetical protein
VRKRPCHGEPVAIDLGFQLHQATHQEADHLGLLVAYDQQRGKLADEGIGWRSDRGFGLLSTI